MPKQSDPCDLYIDEEGDDCLIGVEWDDGSAFEVRLNITLSSGSDLMNGLAAICHHIRSLPN